MPIPSGIQLAAQVARLGWVARRALPLWTVYRGWEHVRPCEDALSCRHRVRGQPWVNASLADLHLPGSGGARLTQEAPKKDEQRGHVKVNHSKVNKD